MKKCRIYFSIGKFFDDKSTRLGAKKDGDDLKAVLEGLKFDVIQYMDLKLDEIKMVLDEGKTLKI